MSISKSIYVATLVAMLPSILASSAAMGAESSGGADSHVEKIVGVQAKNCASSERTIYFCDFGRGKSVRVCASDREISYLFAAGRGREEAISSNGQDDKVHFGFIRGGGPGGNQWDLRFSNGKTSYVVFTAEAGGASGWPGHSSSGISVMVGESSISRLACPRTGVGQKFSIHDIPHFVPRETDQRYLVWY